MKKALLIPLAVATIFLSVSHALATQFGFDSITGTLSQQNVQIGESQMFMDVTDDSGLAKSPGTIMLFGAGLFGAAVFVKRRKAA